MAKSRDGPKDYPRLRPLGRVCFVSGLQHWRTIRGDGHFSAYGMPNGTRVISFACGTGMGGGPHAIPAPF